MRYFYEYLVKMQVHENKNALLKNINPVRFSQFTGSVSGSIIFSVVSNFGDQSLLTV